MIFLLDMIIHEFSVPWCLMQWPLLWLAFQVQVAPSGCPIQIPGDSRATILKSVHRNQSNLRSPKSSNVSNESKIVQIFQFWVHTHRLHNWRFGTAVCVLMWPRKCPSGYAGSIRLQLSKKDGGNDRGHYWPSNPRTGMYMYIYIYVVCVCIKFLYIKSGIKILWVLIDYALFRR